jgi:hypothetical protein
MAYEMEVAFAPDRLDVSGRSAAAAVGVKRAVCGNPECSPGLLTFMKDRRRPMVEQQWCCSARCIEKAVQMAIRRESPGSSALEEVSLHPHRVPLGLTLLAQGWITQPQLQRALEAQQIAGAGRIGEWLVAEFRLRQSYVTRGLGMQWSCPVLSLERFDPEMMAKAVPRILVERLGIVPLRVASGRILYLAFSDRLDASASLAIERMSGLKVESGLLNEIDFWEAQRRLLASTFLEAGLERQSGLDSMSKRIVREIARMRPVASRLVRVHEYYWLRMWLEAGAMSRGGAGIPATHEDVVDRIYRLGAEQ